MSDPNIPADKTTDVPVKGSATAPKADDNLDENGDPWRHPPVAPKDEGPLESLGRSISETITGPSADKDGKQKA